jgi:hypothetical protein
MGEVKTTLEIPDPLYRKLKISAAQRGTTVRQLVNEALSEKLRASPGSAAVQPAWNRAFGRLQHLHKETQRISRIIDDEFTRIDPEEWK